MPKITDMTWTHHAAVPHRISGQDDGPYDDVALGDAVGLTQFGVRLERLPPGSRSSHRHWHETEDELVYMISGELVLIENTETTLVAGDAAGWAAGKPVAHCMENRSSEPAVFLVVGTRAARGTVHYPDHNLVLHHEGGARRFTRTDGSPVESD